MTTLKNKAESTSTSKITEKPSVILSRPGSRLPEIRVTGNPSPNPGNPIAGITAPLVIAGKTLPGINYETVRPTLIMFYDNYITGVNPCVDLKPPYQRQDNIWSDEKVAGFFQSIVNNVPIPSIYLCPTIQGGRLWFPVDGLQRIMSMKRFFNNEVPLKLEITYVNGNKQSRKVTWEEIANDPSYQQIKFKIMNYQLNVVQLSYLPLKEQRLLFVAINSGVPLNDDEHNYCANFLTRRFLRIAYEELLSDWNSVFSKSVFENNRFKGDRTVHELFMMTGLKLADGTEIKMPGISEREHEAQEFNGWDCPALRKQERSISARMIHDVMENQGINFEDNTQVFKDIFDLSFFPVLKAVLNFLLGIYEDSPSLGLDENTVNPYRLPRNILDPVGFFFKKVSMGHVTIAQLQQHRQKIKNILEKYYQEKQTRNYKMSTSDAKMMTAKVNLLEEIFSSRWN